MLASALYLLQASIFNQVKLENTGSEHTKTNALRSSLEQD
jgi:hypothetical protein